MKAYLNAIDYYVPDKLLTNEDLAAEYQDWSAEKILNRTGIAQRHIVSEGETAGELAYRAALALFQSSGLKPEQVDFIFLATQTPDYLLPTTACILQNRLGIPTSAGAIDFNLGCSAYIYGLALSKGLIEAGVARNVLLLTAETYTRHINKKDKSTRTLFGDGGSASWISAQGDIELCHFVLGTDGSGYESLIIPSGGAVLDRSPETAVEHTDDKGYTRSQDNLYMNGAGVLNFTNERVPGVCQEVLQKHGLTLDDIGLFVFHQASRVILNNQIRMLGIPEEKFVVELEDIGNTVSCTIPIALKRAWDKGRLKPGMHVMLVGFGVGLSWGATIVKVGEMKA